MLASQLGFNVMQLDLPQSVADTRCRTYSFRTYLSRLLDILTVGFLTRFHQKPLRFFGTGGAISTFTGLVGLGYIGIERVFFNVAAADRPLLVLFSLFLVLGIQLVAIGLVGETIIFTSAKNNKEYRIRKIINKKMKICRMFKTATVLANVTVENLSDKSESKQCDPGRYSCTLLSVLHVSRIL